MQSDIRFLRTREPPGPQGCLMEKSLNLLHPLANYRGYSRSTVSVLERFVVLIIWPHKPESKSQWCQKSRGYLHKREETLRTCPLLTMYYFSTPRELLTKVDIVGESAWNGDDQDLSQIRESLFGLPYSQHQKYTRSCAKLNEVNVKDVENVF